MPVGPPYSDGSSPRGMKVVYAELSMRSSRRDNVRGKVAVLVVKRHLAAEQRPGFLQQERSL